VRLRKRPAGDLHPVQASGIRTFATAQKEKPHALCARDSLTEVPFGGGPLVSQEGRFTGRTQLSRLSFRAFG
jgi:hypothetical protein